MPLSGISRSCSLTFFSASSRSPVPGSRRTGKMLVNQPSVRARSTSGTISSRPWPSRSSTTSVPPRHFATASASAVSSTSLTAPCTAAGTVVSSGSVRPAGSVTVSLRAVDTRSTAGSSGRRVKSGSAPASIRCHTGSSARRSTSWSAAAQRRKDVPTGARSPPDQARARSVDRIRHETPSTITWCSTRSSRRSGANHTARSMPPRAGASRSAARAVHRSTSSPVSTRSTTSAARTVPGAETSSDQSGAIRDRSRSWWSITLSSTDSSPAASSDAGTWNSIDW